MLKAQLLDKLDALGFPFSKKATKPELERDLGKAESMQAVLAEAGLFAQCQKAAELKITPVLRFDYVDMSGKKTLDRAVYPLHTYKTLTVSTGEVTYTICALDILCGIEKNFRLDRMIAPEWSGERFGKLGARLYPAVADVVAKKTIKLEGCEDLSYMVEGGNWRYTPVVIERVFQNERGYQA